ncbi:MAG: DUF4160 domain-containing protein [Bacteroidaceae bacterium]|nr:DUF4160 domain-containing protein [Bacteroidaceae bacterium]
MPEIFRAYGFVFMFFSHEHEPIHVHVIGNGGDAKYVLRGKKFVLSEKHGINANDLKKIKTMIDDNGDIIVKHWNRYFYGKNYED